MKRDQRLSVALHVLLHMAERPDTSMTSTEMAACAQTNPVVIRRTFAGLRDAGIVRSVKGHGGGWSLARPLAEIHLEEIQRALGERVMNLAHESPGCLVELAVHQALDEAVAEAQQVLDRRLATITLAQLARDVGRLYRARGKTPGAQHDEHSTAQTRADAPGHKNGPTNPPSYGLPIALPQDHRQDETGDLP
jgi:Rrf2 family protein